MKKGYFFTVLRSMQTKFPSFGRTGVGIAFAAITLLLAVPAHAQHPSLLVSGSEVKELKSARGHVAAFDKTIAL